jgi:tetratricopeptide (TPR) repeat protein
VKRSLALVGLVIVVAAGVMIVQHANRDRNYGRLLEAGQQALDGGNSYAAVEAFTGALTLRPDSMVAYYHRGEAYRAQHRDDEAVRDFRDAIRRAPDAPQPLIALGDLYNLTDPAQAALWYGQAVAQLKFDDPALLYKLALARYRAGSPAEALDPLRRAVARNDSLAEAHYLMGLVYRDMQRPNDAIGSLDRAIRLAPGLVAAREELADLYRARGRHVDEMSQLQALSALDGLTDRTVDIALAQARQGQFPAALGTLGQAEARAPSDSHVQLALGRVYLARAERTTDRASIPRALEALEKALGGTARRSEGLALFGRALSLAGDEESAERILREAVATSPVDPEAFAFLAETSERLSHLTEARDALQTLDVLEGDTASAGTRATRAQRIGMLSLRVNDLPAALDYLQQAVDAGKRDARTLGQLAQARFQSGDRAAAQSALDQALAIEPRSAELLRLRRLLR